MSEYDTLEQHDPMPLGEVLEKVREGCLRYMYLIDEEGYCAESDDYVVALAFFEDYMEKLASRGEIPDPYDHIEERERDKMLGDDELLS
jgi:hypothetical protein